MKRKAESILDETKLHKMLKENSFVRQINRLRTQKTVIEDNMIRVLSNQLVKFSTRQKISLTPSLVSDALVHERMALDLDLEEWTAQLQDRVKYGDRLPLVETARAWTQELLKYKGSMEETKRLADLSSFASFASQKLHAISIRLTGLDLVHVMEYQTEMWPSVFAQLGWAPEILDFALEHIDPDLNEAILYYYKGHKKPHTPLDFTVLTPEEAKRRDIALQAEHDALQVEEASEAEVESDDSLISEEEAEEPEGEDLLVGTDSDQEESLSEGDEYIPLK